MPHVEQFDHIGITVADLDKVTAFFVDLGLEIEGRTAVEGDFIDVVTGIPDSRSELGMRNVCFVVEDLQKIVDGLAAEGYGLVGGLGRYEDTWLMAHVRGPEGIVVALTERIG